MRAEIYLSSITFLYFSSNLFLMPSCARPQTPEFNNKKNISEQSVEKTESQLPNDNKGTSSDNAVPNTATQQKTPDSPTPQVTTPATGSTAISFTPVRYADAQYPAYIYAIWITDANGKYIKSVSARAATRMRYLDKWLSSAGVVAPTQPDAVAGASVNYPAQAVPIAVNWDMKDKAGAFVSQGNYFINIQLTSSNNAGLNLAIPVSISAAGMTKADTSMTTGITAVTTKHTP